MHHVSNVDPITIAIIVTCYVVFAVQLFIQAGSDLWRTNSARAIAALVVVFVLCALSGYFTTLVDIGSWRNTLHWGLAMASLWLVLTNRAAVIARLLRDDTY